MVNPALNATSYNRLPIWEISFGLISNLDFSAVFLTHASNENSSFCLSTTLASSLSQALVLSFAGAVFADWTSNCSPGVPAPETGEAEGLLVSLAAAVGLVPESAASDGFGAAVSCDSHLGSPAVPETSMIPSCHNPVKTSPHPAANPSAQPV
ncbi:hypothetical protein D3C76_1071640 [compost metagenome]